MLADNNKKILVFNTFELETKNNLGLICLIQPDAPPFIIRHLIKSTRV